MTPRLLRAFRATAYEAAGITVRIGRRNPEMAALLARHGMRHAGFLTAWNPLGRRHPLGWNHRRQAVLRVGLRRAILAQGHGRLGQWAEAHFLLGLPPPRLRALARRFRQRAFVAVTRGGPARLYLLAG